MHVKCMHTYLVYRYIHIYVCVYIYIYISIHIYLCVYIYRYAWVGFAMPRVGREVDVFAGGRPVLYGGFEHPFFAFNLEEDWRGISKSQVIDSNNELKDCYKEETRPLLANMWAMASMSFVLSMMENGQGTVVALVNKGMEGERALHKAVLYEHEIPTLGVAAYGLGYWSPQVLVIDLQGTCSKTSPALQLQLASRLGAWATSKQKKHWRLQDFVRRSHLHWRCLDCSETCSLDAALAKQVKQLVEALGAFLVFIVV